MKARPWVLVVGFFIVGSAVASCTDIIVNDGERITGSGNVITESRDVSGFDEVVVLGSGDVFIDVTGTDSLTISADDNLMAVLTSDVNGSKLELGVEPNTPISPSQEIEYQITVADLSAVTILGSADFVVSDVDTPSFDVLIAGSGDVQVTGTTESLDVEIDGAGEFAGEGLVAARGSVSIAGSGSVVVNVTEDLDVSIAGTGDVKYIGDPTVKSSIAGSGNVSQQ
ncbi:MAG: DUF2807 domain-containing protein [Acidimicrobiia bacterium]|nr:DUF2807 domain-containing protein [Acidimicrobiia bacterium]